MSTSSAPSGTGPVRPDAASPGGPGGFSPSGLRAGLADPAVRARRRRLAFWPVTEHMLWIYWRYRITLFTSAVGEPIVYLLGMGLGLGVLVGQGGAGTYGVPYAVFVAPALLMSAAIMVGVQECTYQILDGTQWESKNYYTVYQAAVSPGQLTLGVLLAIQLRVLLVGVLYWAAMLLFGVVPHPWWSLLLVPVGCLGALAFGTPVAGYFAGLEREGGRANLVQRFVVMPLVLFGGTYYPLTALPAGMQWVGWMSPVWHASELGRDLSFGHVEPVWLVIVHLAYLVLLVAAGSWWLRRNLTRKLTSS